MASPDRVALCMTQYSAMPVIVMGGARAFAGLLQVELLRIFLSFGRTVQVINLDLLLVAARYPAGLSRAEHT